MDFIKDLTVVNQHVYLNGEEQVGDFTIEEDGKYILEITAEDQLKQENKKSVQFILDSTAPKINAVIDSGENGIITLDSETTVYNQGTIKVNLADSDDWMETLSVNGESKTLADDTNQYEIALNDFGTYIIEVQAVDRAGNTSIFNTIVHYTNKASGMFKYIVIGGICAVILLSGIVIWQSERKKNSKRNKS